MLALLAVTLTTTTGLLGAGFPPTSGVVLGPALAWLLWSRRRPLDAVGVVLRVSRGTLEITASPDHVLLRAELRDLANVTLDSRTIRKVEEGSALVPWARFAEGRVGPELDVVRIVFELVGEPAVVGLTEAYVPHMDGVEWLGKIRRFLRAHGWVPEDERDAASRA
jgi:hypothetical protein